MDGNVLAGVGVLVAINSFLQYAAILRSSAVDKKVDQFIDFTKSSMREHKERIVRLEDRHMG